MGQLHWSLAMILASLHDIQTTFKALIAGTLTREQADRWAFERIDAFDREDLRFDPPGEQERIWSALQYLYGIDLQEAPGAYLHSLDDIKHEFEQRWE